jgi:hypothetical protein
MPGTRFCTRDGVPSRPDGQQQAGIDAHHPAAGRCAESELLVTVEAKLTILQAIEFAREQADEDLWEDLLKYSEDNPSESVASVGSQANPYQSSSGDYWRTSVPISTRSASYAGSRMAWKYRV